jgi:hypothetical protein
MVCEDSSCFRIVTSCYFWYYMALKLRVLLPDRPFIIAKLRHNFGSMTFLIVDNSVTWHHDVFLNTVTYHIFTTIFTIVCLVFLLPTCFD